MLRSIIIDDEAGSRDSLKNMVNNFCANVEVCAMCQNISESVDAIQQHKPDFVFLDVQMKRETGFDLFSRVTKVDFDVIFTTAHTEYAIQAIKFSAIDYLLKPIDIEELKTAVGKVEQKQNSNIADKLHHLIENLKHQNTRNYKIALPTLEGVTFITIDDIIYCQASGNYTEIFTSDKKKHVVSRQLKEYDDLLHQHDFFRIHHSYVINLNAIKNYVKGDGGYVVMNNDVALDVSRRKKDAFLDRVASLKINR